MSLDSIWHPSHNVMIWTRIQTLFHLHVCTHVCSFMMSPKPLSPTVQIFHILSPLDSLSTPPLFSLTQLSNKASLCVRQRVSCFDVPFQWLAPVMDQSSPYKVLDFTYLNMFLTLSQIPSSDHLREYERKGIISRVIFFYLILGWGI